MKKLKTAISGAAGRMGGVLIKLVSSSDDLELFAALEKDGHPAAGRDAGELWNIGNLGVKITSSPAKGADVLVDFSLPDGSIKRLRECARFGTPIVMGTTGFSDAQRAEIKKAAEKIPVVLSANMSPGVNVLAALVEQAARMLGPQYDIELVEFHHNRKLDAPSGTALMLADAARAGRGGAGTLVHGRSGKALRIQGDIGVHAVRGGDVAGDHRVIFAGPSEVVEISHRALDRAVFARGALIAARFAAGKKKGFFAMSDVMNG
jgi:4-hydroxy-tetrahydrodipicolinate reductase